jgi:hypothetical protein
MPHRSRAAIMFAAGVCAVTVSIPAQGQMTGGEIRGTGGFTNISPRPPPFPEHRRREPPPSPPSPRSAAPAPGAGLSSGVITQRQAMDLLAAAGFTNIAPPDPRVDGSWTAYASNRGQRVRATVDPRGNIYSK